MGLIVYTSHNYASLVDELCKKLIEHTRQEILEESIVIVPNHTVANWLSNQIADRLGICLNIRFSYIDSLFESGTETDSPDDSKLLWALDIIDLLKEEDSLFGETTKSNDVASIQYAWEFATILRKYVEFRSSWLYNWSSAYEIDAELSQLYAKCWDAISFAGHSTDDTLVRAIESAKHGQSCADNLPANIHLFGFWEVSPTKWNLLETLLQHCNVHTYLSFPSRTFLVDLTKTNLQLPLFSEVEDTLLNPRLKLLSKLVGRGRGFQAFLLDHNINGNQLPAKLPSGSSLLQALQRLLIEPEAPRSKKTIHRDDTIQIHSCTSRKRELEVAKARIQQALIDDPSLNLEDIHVYAPNIQDYAEWIPVVFAETDGPHTLACSIKESLDPEQIPVFKTVLSILKIPSSTWSIRMIHEIIRLESVAETYKWTTEDIQRIQDWCAKAGIFGGHGSEENDERMIPDTHYSWMEGLRRLIERYCSDPDTLLGRDFTDSPSDYPECFESFICFFRDLERICKIFSQAKNDPIRIIDAIEKISELFIPNDYRPFEQSALEKAVSSIRVVFEVQSHASLTLAEVSFILKKSLPRLPSPSTFSRKFGIQFSSIRFEEIIPSKIKVIMGINDGAFPRNDPQRSYDLMQLGETRFGDPSKRDTDLYWFLQSLILTEKQWILTMIGKDEFTNDLKPLTPLVQSLMETVNDVIPTLYSCSENELLSITPQPRFSYEPDCFTQHSLMNHFSESSFQAAKNVSKEPSIRSFINEMDLPSTTSSDEKHTSSQELIRLFTHPAKCFCEDKLGIKLQKNQGGSSTQEPLLWTIDGLAGYKTNAAGLEAILGGIDSETTHSWLTDNNLLPLGLAGTQMFEEKLYHWESLLKKHQGDCFFGLKSSDFTNVQHSLDDIVFHGPRLKDHHSNIGFVTPGTLKKVHEIEGWIYSLSLSIGLPPEQRPIVTIVGKNKSVEIQPSTAPEDAMITLIELRNRFIQRPLPFYPETSYTAWKGKKTSQELLHHNDWTNSQFGGEYEDPYNRLIVPSDGNPFDQNFYEVAEQIYTLMLECLPAKRGKGKK